MNTANDYQPMTEIYSEVAIAYHCVEEMTKCMDRKAYEYFSCLYLATDEDWAPTLSNCYSNDNDYIYSYNNTRQSYA